MRHGLTMALMLSLLLPGCRAGRWVEDEVAVRCRGGNVVNERRVTDVTVTGRTRNTVTRTDACLD